MKILKDNYRKYKEEVINKEAINNKKEIIEKIEKFIEPYPRKCTCDSCKSELEYKKSDTRIGALGCVYIDCPLCGYENMLIENEQEIELTADNVKFPTHFFHISKETGAVDTCNNEEVKKCIRKGIDYFRNNKNDEDSYTWYTTYGNLFVQIYKYSGDENYWVLVSNNYYDTYIPFEPEDY